LQTEYLLIAYVKHNIAKTDGIGDDKFPVLQVVCLVLALSA
jgi:hypothetical protein